MLKLCAQLVQAIIDNEAMPIASNDASTPPPRAAKTAAVERMAKAASSKSDSGKTRGSQRK